MRGHRQDDGQKMKRVGAHLNNHSVDPRHRPTTRQGQRPELGLGRNSHGLFPVGQTMRAKHSTDRSHGSE